ncbi:cobalamin-dependent protein [Clostridium sp. C2-6-12]|uniref:cobalamin B12-binding domain-containing protein n=1 Tax=Clostridium sp. C2-6-12 TaxID=2698832 RepID=UPI001367A5FD|nr:cobalamin-dependent protein [Clostridium sp. C2-6-12]
MNYLLNFEKQKAAKFILDKLENNVDIREVYIKYLQGALYEIGDLWMNGKISIAKEHYCTALIQHIVSLIYPYLFQNSTNKGKVMFSVSAGNELHEIGIRMVTDFFELDGWDTYYLGANLPIQAIIRELKEKKVDLLAISITMGNNIQFATDLISNIRSNEALRDIKIIVGGRIFNQVKGLWKKTNADGYGENAYESVRIGNELVEKQERYMVKEG